MVRLEEHKTPEILPLQMRLQNASALNETNERNERLAQFPQHLAKVQALTWNGALQSVIELSRTQDEEVGDGTTSVIILGT